MQTEYINQYISTRYQVKPTPAILSYIRQQRFQLFALRPLLFVHLVFLRAKNLLTNPQLLAPKQRYKTLKVLTAETESNYLSSGRRERICCEVCGQICVKFVCHNTPLGCATR